jgi:hypothetical protein
MRNIHIADRTVSKGGSKTKISVNMTEFNRAMKKAQKDIADAMFEGSGIAFATALNRTDSYLRGRVAHTPQAKKVADSLDYTKGKERRKSIKITDNEVTMEAMFGSRGPNKRTGEIGFGVHTSRDDNGGTFNIGQAVEEGISPRTFSFKSSGAATHGRQIGRAKGPTAWYGKGGTAEFQGIIGAEYIDFAMRIFDSRIETAVKRSMKRKLE